MENLSQRIVQHIDQNFELDNTQREVIAFGIQSALEIGLNLVVSILVLYKLHMLKEGLFFFLIFIPLRKYSGGYHADTYIKCFIFSIVTLIIVMKGSLLLRLSNMSSMIVVVLLSCAMWKIGPASVAERPVSEREYRKFRNKFKKTS